MRATRVGTLWRAHLIGGRFERQLPYPVEAVWDAITNPDRLADCGCPSTPTSLLCRYDHPATDCQVMGAEINRRLALD